MGGALGCMKDGGWAKVRDRWKFVEGLGLGFRERRRGGEEKRYRRERERG